MLISDAVTTHTHGKSVDTIEDNLQSEFENTLTWGKENKMQVHLAKTTCMLAGTRHQIHESRPLSIKAEDVNIQTVSKQKLLGVYIDETLTWNPQIDYLYSNISSKVSLLCNWQHIFRSMLKNCIIKDTYSPLSTTAPLLEEQPPMELKSIYLNCKNVPQG